MHVGRVTRGPRELRAGQNPQLSTHSSCKNIILFLPPVYGLAKQKALKAKTHQESSPRKYWLITPKVSTSHSMSLKKVKQQQYHKRKQSKVPQYPHRGYREKTGAWSFANPWHPPFLSTGDLYVCSLSCRNESMCSYYPIPALVLSAEPRTMSSSRVPSSAPNVLEICDWYRKAGLAV